jgi:hypothetical protein
MHPKTAGRMAMDQDAVDTPFSPDEPLPPA